jgi:hypothetical protein
MSLMHRRTLTTAAALIGLFTFVAIAAPMAARVSIWLDEVVQMAGLHLSPWAILDFLRDPSPLGGTVGHDQSLPLSYWLGWCWAQIFGLSIPAMRWFGICVVGMACVIMAAVGSRLGGPSAAFVGALAFATSPNVVSYAIGIRYYPLLLLWSACSFYCFVRWVEEPQRRRWWTLWLTASLVAAIHTHAYGVVLAAALWTSAVLLEERGRPTRSTLAGAAITLAATLPLAAFFTSAVNLKTGILPVEAPSYLVARLLYRPFGHAAIAASNFALGAILLGTVVATTIVATSNAVPRAARAVLAALALGLATTIAAAVLRPQLGAIEPRYSMWMLPGMAAVLAAAATARRPGWRFIGIIAAALVLGANAYGSVVLVRHAPLFWMGAYDQLRPLLDCRGAPVDAVVHEGDGPWAFVQAPIFHHWGSRMAQYVHDPQDDTATVVRRLPAHSPAIDLHDLAARCIVVIHSRMLRSAEIDQLLHGKFPDLGRGAIAQQLATSPGWRLLHETLLWSYVAAHVTVYERAAPERQGTRQNRVPLCAKSLLASATRGTKQACPALRLRSTAS